MRAMNLDCVKPQGFCLGRGLRERPDRFGDVLFRHRDAADFPRCNEARRTLKRSRWQPTGLRGRHDPDMPELGGHDATGCVHPLDHASPSPK